MSQQASLRLQQEVSDTYRLAQIGGYFYLAGWLVVANYGFAFTHSLPAAIIFTFMFLALAIFRRVHRPPAGNADVATSNKWLVSHWCIVWVTTALFGIVFLWTMVDQRMHAAHTAVLLSTMGLAVAIAHAFSMRLWFAFPCVAMMYLPGLLALWMLPSDRASAWVMSVYLLYVVATLWRSHQDYQHRLDIDQQLREQRDLFEQQGRIDALTELANRRFFTETLMRMSENANGSESSLILMVLDLDHFKDINDQHGHAAGDACLATFASRLKQKFGNGADHVARLGGEEFGVLLKGHSLAEALQRAEDFRSVCVGQPIIVGDVAISITVSIGIAEFDRAIHRDGDGLYRAADSAVYRAKHSGRNRVCVQETEST